MRVTLHAFNLHKLFVSTLPRASTSDESQSRQDLAYHSRQLVSFECPTERTWAGSHASIVKITIRRKPTVSTSAGCVTLLLNPISVHRWRGLFQTHLWDHIRDRTSTHGRKPHDAVVEPLITFSRSQTQ
ncbi:hypothetical protein BHE90_014778 [Fusarium euwallaceae]|uniref:Uncharacterized protein n=1 Tax=Fusarium euwallaceae TaxID=1147111 RepID=A0A430L550_9HYPO|nr:hypothetical protein BHE90_014778 [Fusarium euwallaceae]